MYKSEQRIADHNQPSGAENPCGTKMHATIAPLKTNATAYALIASSNRARRPDLERPNFRSRWNAYHENGRAQSKHRMPTGAQHNATWSMKLTGISFAVAV